MCINCFTVFVHIALELQNDVFNRLELFKMLALLPLGETT